MAVSVEKAILWHREVDNHPRERSPCRSRPRTAGYRHTFETTNELHTN
jgi:hypothetical protein